VEVYICPTFFLLNYFCHCAVVTLDVTLGLIHLRVTWGVQNTCTSGVYDLNNIDQINSQFL